jgi:hypothetical protein
LVLRLIWVFAVIRHTRDKKVVGVFVRFHYAATRDNLSGNR